MRRVYPKPIGPSGEPHLAARSAWILTQHGCGSTLLDGPSCPIIRPTMTIHRSLLSLAAFATLSLSTLSSTAFAADSTGAAGTLDSVEINNPTADTYLQYHGRVVINSAGKLTEYRWGGTSCSTKVMSESVVALLWDAFYNRGTTTITPRFQAGQGTNKCLVGFSLAPAAVAPPVVQ